MNIMLVVLRQVRGFRAGFLANKLVEQICLIWKIQDTDFREWSTMYSFKPSSLSLMIIFINKKNRERVEKIEKLILAKM